MAVAVGESWVLRGKLWHCARVNDKQNYGLTMNERVNTHAIQLDQVTGLRMFYRELIKNGVMLGKWSVWK